MIDFSLVIDRGDRNSIPSVFITHCTVNVFFVAWPDTREWRSEFKPATNTKKKTMEEEKEEFQYIIILGGLVSNAYPRIHPCDC